MVSEEFRAEAISWLTDLSIDRKEIDNCFQLLQLFLKQKSFFKKGKYYNLIIISASGTREFAAFLCHNSLCVFQSWTKTNYFRSWNQRIFGNYFDHLFRRFSCFLTGKILCFQLCKWEDLCVHCKLNIFSRWRCLFVCLFCPKPKDI